MVFKNEKQLRQHLLTKCQPAVREAQERIYHILNMFLSDFYKGYDPKVYHRTYQLFQSLVKSDVKISGKKVTAEVYFDLSGIDYSTNDDKQRPTGEQVMDAAKKGAHGAIGRMDNGKNFYFVGGNASVNVWEAPMRTIDAEAINTLVEMLIREGIPVKKI